MENMELILLFAKIARVLAIISFVGVMHLGISSTLTRAKRFKASLDILALFYLVSFFALVIIGVELSIKTMPGNVTFLLIILLIALLIVYSRRDKNEEANERKGPWEMFKKYISFLLLQLSEKQRYRWIMVSLIFTIVLIIISLLLIFVLFEALVPVMATWPSLPFTYFLLFCLIFWNYCLLLSGISDIVIACIFIAVNRIRA